MLKRKYNFSRRCILSNRLNNEKSPYLLQHKNNPVDWYPWCDEAFEKAEKEEKPAKKAAAKKPAAKKTTAKKAAAGEEEKPAKKVAAKKPAAKKVAVKKAAVKKQETLSEEKAVQLLKAWDEKLSTLNTYFEQTTAYDGVLISRSEGFLYYDKNTSLFSLMYLLRSSSDSTPPTFKSSKKSLSNSGNTLSFTS